MAASADCALRSASCPREIKTGSNPSVTIKPERGLKKRLRLAGMRETRARNSFLLSRFSSTILPSTSLARDDIGARCWDSTGILQLDGNVCVTAPGATSAHRIQKTKTSLFPINSAAFRAGGKQESLVLTLDEEKAQCLVEFA
jgi:hypothetical protein